MQKKKMMMGILGAIFVMSSGREYVAAQENAILEEAWTQSCYERVMMQCEKMLAHRVSRAEMEAEDARWKALLAEYQNRLDALTVKLETEKEERSALDEGLAGQKEKLDGQMAAFRGENLRDMETVMSDLQNLQQKLSGGNATAGETYTDRLYALYEQLDNAQIYVSEDNHLWASTRTPEQTVCEVGFCYNYFDDTLGTISRIPLTVVKRGQGEYGVEEKDGGMIAIPQREGWNFDGWRDGDNHPLLAAYVEENKHWYATWRDDIIPVLDVDISREAVDYVDVTVRAVDLGSGVRGVYFGNKNPQSEDISYESSDTATFRIDAPGHYYAAAIDISGNMECQELDAYEITLQEVGTILGTNREWKNLPEVSKTGYDFIGWIPAGESETKPAPISSVLVEKPMELAPCFEAKKYRISLNPMGGSCETDEILATYGKQIGELPIPQRTGYLFCGWKWEEASAEYVTSSTVMDLAQDATLVAAWEPISYVIHFEPNALAHGEMDSMQLKYDESVSLSRNQFWREGYVFMGWSTDPAAVSTQNSLTARDRSYNQAEWLNEDVVSNLACEDGDEVTLYAIWQEIVPGVMDYRYCMGSYQYFACVTTQYVTDYGNNEGALFVAMSPSGQNGHAYGGNAIWADSAIRSSLNSEENTDLLGIRLTNTTVNKSYSGMFYNYSPSQQAPCTRSDMGLNTPMAARTVASAATYDYLFIPDMADCYRYYTGSSWNWFWDMDLNGVPDTYRIAGLDSSGMNSAVYYPSIQAASDAWTRLGWNGRVWLRNYYTGYTGYPIFVAQYGIGPCNPDNGAYAVYRNCCSFGYLVRAMYTRAMS